MAKELDVFIDHRKNVHAKNGIEWALNANLDGKTWTIITYDKEPSREEVRRVRAIILRSMEFFHSTLRVPRFDIT